MLISPSYRKQHLDHAIRDGRLEISGAHVQLLSMAWASHSLIPCCIFVVHAVFVGWYDACSIPGEFSAYTQFLTKAKFLMSTMLPMISMIISDILIIRALRKSRQILHKHNDKSTDHIIPTLLTATIVFLILRLPYVAFNFFQLLPQAKSAPCRDAIIPIFAYVANLCDCINHSINMFLYCMTGRRFRAALIRLFLCGSCKGRTGDM